ncbi:MAG: DNA recombination protein RmuC [Bacteroidetes bacterium]|nr:DNA recombination protein RmuC [Bacteroidota bacterium]
MTTLVLILVGLNLVFLVILLVRSFQKKDDQAETLLNPLNQTINRVETSVREEIRMFREETSKTGRENRQEQTDSLNKFQQILIQQAEVQSKQLEVLTKTNQDALQQLTQRIDTRLVELATRLETTLKDNRTELQTALKQFQESFQASVKDFNDLQKQKFDEMGRRQDELIKSTELKLEKMRETVDEKLHKTLEERLGQSFKLVSEQLQAVQKGLGEMQTLAVGVGDLKKVLNNVKTRGVLGEIQLGSLLEQVLTPEQYLTNVKTKKGSADAVEFAIKLPGKDEENNSVLLPIDAKFPYDKYNVLLAAYEVGDLAIIDQAQKDLEKTLKVMAKDIRDKYLDPPHTTDFAIMFLPFEGLYAEVVRKSALIEELLRDYKVTVTGPTTLAAILNSLQMGFRTLAIQKRSGEVWRILGEVKSEFATFGTVLSAAQKKIKGVDEDLDKLIGTRSKAIERKLREVQVLPAAGEPLALIEPETED